MYIPRYIEMRAIKESKSERDGEYATANVGEPKKSSARKDMWRY
jgi:hypothetical protein